MSKKATKKGAGSSPNQRGPASFVSDQAQVQSALGQLISQFSQKLAFLRELVQNSLDAGSNRIEVSVEFDQESGLNLITVSDTGDGMDREAIDEKLTRLFASSKEDDLTKVGKFGVGFVSVFSCQPEAVVVDTGRNGESWRIIFHPDRSFDRVASEDQMEGTTVRVYLKPSSYGLKELQKDGLETLQYWCKHCHCEILFNEQLINQPFSLEKSFSSQRPNLFEVYHESSLVRLSLAVIELDSSEHFQGFYNGGITLWESRKEQVLQGVHFKIDSRYLEHTISRDQVEKDENYNKAIAGLGTVLSTTYVDQLFHALETQPEPKHWKALGAVASRFPDLKGRFAKCRCWPIFSHCPTETQLAGFGEITGHKVALQSELRTPLVDKLLEKPDRRPMLTALDSWQCAALDALGIQRLQVNEVYSVAEVVDSDPSTALLENCLKRVGPMLKPDGWLGSLTGWGGRLKSIWLGRWTIQSDTQMPFLASYSQPGVPISNTETEINNLSERLMLNVDHPLAAKVSNLASKDSALAALWLAQMISLRAPQKSRDESPKAYSDNLKFIQKLYEQHALWAAASAGAQA